MAAKSPLNLLLAHEDGDEANRYVSLARNAGYQVTAKHIHSEESLPALLQKSSWDLILVHDECTSPSPTTVFQHTRSLNKDIPAIILSENPRGAVLAGLRMGASDVIGVEDDQHLLLTISRTLFNLKQRRQLRYWQRRYAEAEKRCHGLLNNSKDAIAIVKEGMYIYINESFAHLFGYLNADDMECLPVLDTVAPESSTKIKPLLKMLFTDQAWDPQEIHFRGLRADNAPIELNMNTFQVEFDDEPALQFLIKHSDSQFDTDIEPSQSVTEDILAEINLCKLIEQVDSAIGQAMRSHQDSLLLHIHINHFERLRQENGLHVTEGLFQQVAQILTAKQSFKQTVGRFSADSFLILLSNADAKTGLQLAEEACQQIADTVFEVNSQTFSLTISIGLSVISDASSTAEDAIDRCLKATDELTHSNNTEGNCTKLFEAVFLPHLPDLSHNIEEIGRDLLSNNLLELFYQPVISLHGDDSQFYEVLIHLKREANPKDFAEDFVEQLFKTGAALDIDYWVIEMAIQMLSHKLKSDPNTRLFINISQATFCESHFITWLANVLNNSDVPHNALIFQLREMDVGSHLIEATSITKQLQKLGSGVALAHFGLAIDPLNLLQRLAVDYVKLDRQLVDRAQADPEELKSMERLLEKLRNHNQKLIVPFIEKAAMMPSLWKLGVHYVQGHYLQAPQAEMNYLFSDE